MDRQYSSLVGQAGGVRYSNYDVSSELANAGWKPGQVQSYAQPSMGMIPAVSSYWDQPTRVALPAAYASPVATYLAPPAAPQKFVQERVREVRNPYTVERIIEVPKPEIRHVHRQGPPVIREEEQIIEIPQVIYEERIIHVSKKEIQERLIEVPKIEWVETLEYEDRIEYREVCVDKIIEVPEIEYRVREVEQLVPQQYVEEYFVDNYKELPMAQVQEVERTEYAPATQAAVAPRATLVSAPQLVRVNAPQVMTYSAPQQAQQVMTFSAPQQAQRRGRWVFQESDSPPVPPASTASPPVPLSSNLSMVFPPAASQGFQALKAAPAASIGSIGMFAPPPLQQYTSYNPMAAGTKLLTPPTPPAAYSPVVPSTTTAYGSAAVGVVPSLVSVF